MTSPTSPPSSPKQDGGGKQIVVIVDGIDTLEVVPHLSLLHAWMPAAALAWPARIRFSFTSTKSDIYTAVVAGYADVHEVQVGICSGVFVSSSIVALIQILYPLFSRHTRQPPTLDLDASRKIFADSVKAWNRTTTDLQREVGFVVTAVCCLPPRHLLPLTAIILLSL